MGSLICHNDSGSQKKLSFSKAIDPNPIYRSCQQIPIDLPYRHYLNTHNYIISALPTNKVQFNSDRRIKIESIQISTIMIRRTQKT